jgi:hypothetical protein
MHGEPRIRGPSKAHEALQEGQALAILTLY